MKYDAYVIGAGPAGTVCAGELADGGMKVGIAERELVGGECSYWACMPSKALLRSPQAVDEARAVDGARQAVSGAVDATAVLARRDKFTANWQDDGQVRWLDSVHVALVRGWGRLAGERRVDVTGARSLARVLDEAGRRGIEASVEGIPPTTGGLIGRVLTGRPERDDR